MSTLSSQRTPFRPRCALQAERKTLPSGPAPAGQDPEGRVLPRMQRENMPVLAGDGSAPGPRTTAVGRGEGAERARLVEGECGLGAVYGGWGAGGECG